MNYPGSRNRRRGEDDLEKRFHDPVSEVRAQLDLASAPSILETAVNDELRGQRRATVVIRTYLFVVLDGDRPLAGGARFSLDGVDEVVICRGKQRASSLETRDGVRRLTLTLPSPLLSCPQARLRRGPEGWAFEDAHSRNGTYLNGQRVAHGLLEKDDVLEVGHTFLVIRAFPQRTTESASDLDTAELEGELSAVRTLVPTVATRLHDLRRVARSSIAVLLCGETGTGKEVLARALHQLSQRPGPFVAVNCSTLTNGLAGSQLLGHVRGAFSGAVSDAIGFIRAAEGGTLLLDEVADLSTVAQGALLRVLQEREVIPVGRARPEAVDVRFVATTSRSLDVAVRRDRFRSDLFARFSGFVHQMTPLRNRREDLGLLTAVLLRKAGASDRDGLRMAPETGLELVRNAWPLNVRELEQVLVRSRLLSEEGVMTAELGFAAVAEASMAPPARPLSNADKELHAYVSEALIATKGNVSAAARTLGKGRVQMYRLIRRLSIDPKPFRL
jgi:DNA-binding NtrC family response regulator